MVATGHAHLEDGGARRKALSDLGGEGQVLESGIVVVQVQQVDENCGAAGGSQGRPPTCRDQGQGFKGKVSSRFQPFSLKQALTSMQTVMQDGAGTSRH